jgi:hypothetical protein
MQFALLTKGGHFMDFFVDKLKDSIILSREDILLLRKTINEENPYLDDYAKAHILARSIHNSLDKSLKGFTKDYKINIKTNLIRNTFLNSKDSIYQYDVLKACAASQDVSLEFIYQVNKWVNKQIDTEIPLNIIKHTIEEINIEAEKDIKDDISLSKILEEDDDETVYKPTENEIPDSIPPTEDFIDEEATLGTVNPSPDEDDVDDADIETQINIQHDSIIKYITEFKDKIIENIKANMPKDNIKKYILIYSLALCLLIIPITRVIKIYIEKRGGFFNIVVSADYNDSELDFGKNDEDIIISEELQMMTSHLPDYLKYKRINKEGLKNYLIEKDSLLSKEPYFSTVIECAKEFNLNPILLFSIAGHEQSFVPKDNDAAEKIINNPYNVFESWEKYNTNLTDSSKIASRTVINKLKNRPENEDPFKWINKKYAADKNWWKGVREIYYTLEEKAK